MATTNIPKFVDGYLSKHQAYLIDTPDSNISGLGFVVIFITIPYKENTATPGK
ncbi:hypothetical protein [Geitlerinema sp. PCC 9228]|uniref:hypothetical protein n=1 Tax=Geitlerinema sp. PCC 9228 TaxID=111611 RepID=UPI00147A0FA3|nr:hypothetical protein [Geitlerinema sp. PCC 9228]